MSFCQFWDESFAVGVQVDKTKKKNWWSFHWNSIKGQFKISWSGSERMLEQMVKAEIIHNVETSCHKTFLGGTDVGELQFHDSFEPKVPAQC